MYTTEIYLNKPFISKDEWFHLIKKISKYNGYLKNWSIIIKITNNQISYYLKTNYKIPSTFLDNTSFLFKETANLSIAKSNLTSPTILPIAYNVIDCLNYFHIKKHTTLKYINIRITMLKENRLIPKINLYIVSKNKLLKSPLFFHLPSTILSIDFKKNNAYTFQKTPKYLDISKIIPLLNQTPTNSIFQVDTFPYKDEILYLDNSQIDFNRHSLVIGSSGSGKSKFLSFFIKSLHDTSPHNYKIVMIDPHASIMNDIGAISNLIDFTSIEDSIDLFASPTTDIIATTELTLDLFKTLISDSYNSKLERVLRHSIYLLLTYHNFNFNSLKNILIDSSYRSRILSLTKNYLPESVIHFFLNDFNDLKTKSYGEAISPIISFIDEMSMIPVFNYDSISTTLKSTITNNFLTLFSLDKTKLGDRITKTIAGFIMQQLLILIETKQIKEHIIFIIDEVPVIENQILCRYLSEARKYNLSLILASQYFNQISPSLKDAIFANTINYYIFRISRTDAPILSNHLDINIPSLADKTSDEQLSAKTNLLSNLNNRECLIRISANDKLLPSFKARTLDFHPLPFVKKEVSSKKIIPPPQTSSTPISFQISNTDPRDILRQTSSSRMVVK